MERERLEKIIRPIVEGQIRGFLKEHPEVLEAVNWYKPRAHDPATTFTNSLSKRIVRDLISDRRLHQSPVEHVAAGDD